MKNMKIRTKLILGFALPIILSILNVMVGISSVRAITNEVVDMNTQEFQTIKDTMEEIGADEEKAQILFDKITVSKAADMEAMTLSANQSNALSVGLITVSVLVSLFIAFSLIKTINKSISQLSRASKEIAQGRVDVELVKMSNDEFGELVDTYREVIDNVRQQAEVAEEVASGNLTVQVNAKSEQDVLSNALKRLVEDNLHALTNINDAGAQVTVSSAQVASASQALAQGSTEQASAIEQITASIDEIAEKTKQNAEQANEASNLVDNAINDVKAGNEQMKSMMGAMEDINKSSESISKIIKVIDDIAFQTNILALNAAVEAARAGEAGKGFAVVAEEVRSLAAKSAAAAAETAELIEASINKVNAGSKIADETAKAMEAIANIVEQSEVLINGIAESSNYQATAVAQVEQAIAQVSQVVQTNSATSEQCAAASEELSNQAARMKEMLAIYQLGTPNASSFKDSSSYQGSSSANANEQLISLGDGFDKY